MSLITIGTSVVDVADVALVAPRGSVSQVYLADGSQLASALSAAAQATAVNATPDGTLLTTVVVSTNYGSCYISGRNTQRVDTDAAGTGTIWFLKGGPGPVICAATDLATAQTLINATAGSSGGGIGTTFVPTLTPVSGTTASLATTSTYTRNGNVVQVNVALSLAVTNGNTLSVALTNLPFNITTTAVQPVLRQTISSGTATLIFTASPTNATTITVAATAAAGADTSAVVILHFTYLVA